MAPYQPLPGGVVPDGSPEVVRPEDFKALLESDGTDSLVVGDWISLPDSMWTGLHRVRKGRPRFPSAETLLDIAMMKVRKDLLTDAADIRPKYMREPDVDINWTAFRSEGAWPE